MINQVGNNYAQMRAFQDFKQPQNGYFIMPQEEEKKGISGKKIAFYAMGAGFGLLALTKGVMSKSFAKVLNKWKISLEEKLAKTGKLKNFYRFTLGKIETFSGKMESINNFTTLKDVAVQRLMYGKNNQRTFTRKIHERITKIFDRISRRTVNSSYAKTHRRFAGLNDKMTAINEKLLRDNPNNPNIQDAIDKIKQRMDTVNKGLTDGFGINARNQRLEQMNKASKGLFDDFWNKSLSDIKNNFKSKNMWNSYIAETYLLPHKLKMANETSLLRQKITHDINDNYKASIEAFDNIQKFVKLTDAKTNSVLNDLRNNLAEYKKLSGENEILKRRELNEKITSNLRRLDTTFKEGNYTPEAINGISSYITGIEQIISKSSKGELQEILTLYKKILPRSEYLQLKKQVQNTVKSLDKSIDTETNKYFDKARDLKLGAAPTDVISILGTAGAVGWFLGKSKDRDERISASLQYGIPAVGAIATSLYCTARLIAGGRALLFGLLSGWAINKVGVFADNIRKQYALDVSLHSKKPQSDKV